MDTMLQLAEIRICAGRLGIESIVRTGPDMVFTVRDFKAVGNVFEGAAGSVRLPDDHTVYWRPPSSYYEMPTLTRVLLKRLSLGEG